MIIATSNIFGTGELADIDDVPGKIYATCAACMSIYSEFLSWANYNSDRMVKDPSDAHSIIVLSCQVTDLAVSNDLKHLEMLMSKYPGKRFFVGGCLSKRFDIPIPAMRLDNIKSDYQEIYDKSLVNYENPFWVKDFENSEDGHLFRDMYPLRIGVGCHGKCEYCTINVTRGKAYELEIGKLEEEFVNNEDVVLIADSVSKEQVAQWCDLAIDKMKQISFRNLEPYVAVESIGYLLPLAELGLLKILHVPIQSPNPDVLKDMKRHVRSTETYINILSQMLKSKGVYLATNIIIDYKDFPNPDMNSLRRLFSYVSWNPYWNGVWMRSVAEERFKVYLS